MFQMTTYSSAYAIYDGMIPTWNVVPFFIFHIILHMYALDKFPSKIPRSQKRFNTIEWNAPIGSILVSEYPLC